MTNTRSTTDRARGGFAGELTVGRVFGFPIRLHWTFFLLALWLAINGFGYGLSGLVDTVGWLAVVFTSVLIHELAHALTGRGAGAGVEDILLFPLGGATRLNRLPERIEARAWMTAAGPLTSLILAAMFGLLAVVADSPLLPVDVHHGSLPGRIFWLNIILGAFNLLPVFPMDGGRLLQTGLQNRLGEMRATMLAARIGQVIAVAMAIVGLFVNLWLTLIGLYLFIEARSEAKADVPVDPGLTVRREARIGGET